MGQIDAGTHSFRPGIRRLAPIGFLLAVVAGQLWPLTVLGRRPVGGDVTRFFYPLMTYYHRALAAHRVPLWNQLWGFGFPGLAESQMGVFYPPHLLLFGLCSPTRGYSLNMLVHLVLAAWLAYACGRMFGLGRWGATLSGLSYAGNGLLVIHRAHQWSYVTACWLPLAVGLAWMVLRSGVARGRGPAAAGLALVLAVQLLAGHFQFAFETQVAVLLLAAAVLFQDQLRRRRARGRAMVEVPEPGAGRRSRTRSAALDPQPSGSSLGLRLLLIAAAWAAAWPLAAVQILPTWRLVAYALPHGHDYEYLSGFAQTPLHLISYAAPALFHVNPLWRPVAWEPYHTSPEECQGYVGLVPLGLAIIALVRWRREPRVRAWGVLAAISLVLSLGPYMPGFRGLITLPGFNDFRAPARWGIVTALALALLAGRALDGLAELKAIRRWTLGLLALAAAAIGLYVGAIGSLADMAARPHTAAQGWIGTTWHDWLAWKGDPRFDAVLKRLTAPPAADLHTLAGLARLGYDVNRSRPYTLAEELPAIWCQELLPTGILMAGVGLAVVVLGRRPRALGWALVGLTVADLTWAGGRLSTVEFADLPPIERASPTLRYLGRTAGARCISGLPNLPMVVGADELTAYRTLDVPAPVPASDLLRFPGDPYQATLLRQTMRLVGARFRVFDPEATGWLDRMAIRARTETTPERDDPGRGLPATEPGPPIPFLERREFHDPALARCLYGEDLVRQYRSRVTRFSVWSEERWTNARAWLRPLGPGDSVERILEGDPLARAVRQPDLPPPAVLLLHDAVPLTLDRDQPESLEWTATTPGPALVFLADLYDPAWKATLEQDGRRRPVEVHKALGGWRAVVLPAAGTYRVRMMFERREFHRGTIISLVSLLSWCLVLCLGSWVGRMNRKRP